MNTSELSQIIAAIIILWVSVSAYFLFRGDYDLLAMTFFFSALIIAVNILAKKAVAFLVDSDIEHSIWQAYRFGFRPEDHFKKEKSFGIIVPLVASIVTLGALKFMAILTYETRALKARASKRFGYFSYTEMSDFHNGLIGAGGIVAVLLLSVISYFAWGSNDLLWRFSIYYAFWNMLPISKLDGTQIFFGSRILWTVLGSITLIFTIYALVLP